VLPGREIDPAVAEKCVRGTPGQPAHPEIAFAGGMADRTSSAAFAR
jgi:hypothetical protein